MKLKIKKNNNIIFDKTISSLKVLKELVQFKDILKSIDLDLVNKKSITLNFENKYSYTFYNLTKNTYNNLDIQIIKLFFN